MFAKTKNFIAFALLLLVAAGAQPAYTAMWQWSKTPATNGSADPSIDWSEGMSPSSINDSARAMMARLAEYRDDVSGAITTSGTSSAYTVTTNQGTIPAPPPDGTQVVIVPHATNAASATLQVDNDVARAILANGSALISGVMISGTPYRLTYKTTVTSWVLQDLYGNPYNVPLGGLLAYTGATTPNSSFVLPAGQCISTTTYANYWNLMGQPGVGPCSAGQFQLVDMRGRVPAGIDNLNGTAAGRLTSLVTGCGAAFTSVGSVCPNGAETYALAASQIPSITSNGSVSVSVASTRTDYLNSNANMTGANVAAGGNPIVVFPNGASSALTQVISSGSGSASVSSNNTGGGAFPKVMPVIGVTYLLRVL
jgi:hypothetical protein